jgi:hypothetical protein
MCSSEKYLVGNSEVTYFVELVMQREKYLNHKTSDVRRKYV